jgi:ligand-binding SRPBCC domain-containing protein
MAVFTRSFDLTASLEEVWKFHSDPAALARITPKPLKVAVEICDYPVTEGSRVNLRLSVGPVGVRWNSVITEFKTMERFSDAQVPNQGPFKRWKHTHSFTPIDGGTRVTDHVEYEMPLGALGRIADVIGGRFMIASMFNARSRATRILLERGSA